MANISNLYIDAGSDFNVTITVNEIDGDQIVLTDYTIASQMRKSYSSSVVYNFDTSVTEDGKIALSLGASASNNISPGRWLYDVEILHNDTGSKQRVVEGIVILSPQITKI